nr:hypothetical protein Iba_chr02bCG5670 [Ipomoea batatas]GMD71205.1 hypothetical protein Iba_scaffold50456CG0020 [Ipomoea batatas]
MAVGGLATASPDVNVIRLLNVVAGAGAGGFLVFFGSRASGSFPTQTSAFLFLVDVTVPLAFDDAGTAAAVIDELERDNFPVSLPCTSTTAALGEFSSACQSDAKLGKLPSSNAGNGFSGAGAPAPARRIEGKAVKSGLR